MRTVKISFIRDHPSRGWRWLAQHTRLLSTSDLERSPHEQAVDWVVEHLRPIAVQALMDVLSAALIEDLNYSASIFEVYGIDVTWDRFVAEEVAATEAAFDRAAGEVADLS